jgi:glutamyl-tRNA reductase
MVGTNHNYSPVEFRERIYFSKKGSQDSLDFLKERGILKGAVILSTCNRVEVYASAPEPEKGIEEIKDFISMSQEVDINKFSSYLYIYKGIDAARHLFLVTCGMDSMIPGETQILEQVKASLAESDSKGFLDSFLKAIFHSATSFVDKAHAESIFFKDNISIGTIAVEFIKDRISSLAGKNILIIGAGRVIELVARHLEKETPEVIFISTRSFEKAKDLSMRIKAKAVRFDELKKFLNSADIIITATRSPHFIIDKKMLEYMIDHKILIIDLAMPRDVDPEVKNMKGVELFYLEDLKGVIEKKLAGKACEIGKLKNLIEIEAEKSWKELTELEPEPALLP